MNFEELKGKTIVAIEGLEVGSDRVTFTLSDGMRHVMYHSQECCESVLIEDLNGDVKDLLDSEILLAVESTNTENPPDAKPETIEGQDTFLWTFYRLSTIKGTVVIRWYGESNGYYSERVDFVEEARAY
jgi:hypothetical protein